MLCKEGQMRTLLLFIVVAALAGIAIADTNVTGKWSGSLNVTDENGGTKESTAVLILKQSGSEITGTVGPDDGEQHTITKGKIDGDKITLESADGNVAIKLDLALAGDRITGNVSAVGEGRNMKGKIDVTRAK
jgi:hypothetical protein